MRSLGLFVPDLHRLGDKAPHLTCCCLLHITGGVGVGVQGEAGGVVAQDAGHCLGVYAALPVAGS